MLKASQMFLKCFLIIQLKHILHSQNIGLILAPACEFLSPKRVQLLLTFMKLN